MKTDFVGSAYKGRSIAIDGQECVNFYVELNGPGAKSPGTLIPTPGLELFMNVGNLGGCRGLFTTSTGRLLTVIGNTLYEINTNKTAVSRGTLSTNTGRASFAEVITSTGSIVQIVDGAYGYTLTTESNTFAVITGDYQPGTSIISLNGMFVQNTLESYNGATRFIYSGQYDNANTWASSIDYYTAEVSPDPIYAIQNINSEVWLMGKGTIEVWYMTGDALNPFSRNASGVINIGVAGYYASCQVNNYIGWVGSNIAGNGQIWLASGYIPQRISTHAIEYILGQMGRLDDCVSFAYQQEGHIHLVFNFLSGNRTLVYDMTTQSWHERASYDTTTGVNNHHRVIACTLWDRRLIVGDYANSNIYIWDLDTYTDNGKIIRRIRTATHIHEDRKRLFFRQFELDMERGVGTMPLTGPTDEPGTDPQCMLQYSDDGGFTWSNELWTSAGRIGDRFAIIRWSRLGMSRDRVFRVTFTDPNRFIITGARMDTQVAVR